MANTSKPNHILPASLRVRLWDRRQLLERLGLWSSIAASWPLLKGCDEREAIDFLEASQPPNPRNSPINTTVVVMMENRSFDHVFASYGIDDARRRNDLLTVPADWQLPGPQGQIYLPTPATRPCLLDPPHGWDDSRLQLNGGANDGFALNYFDRWQLEQILADVIAYQRRSDLPFSYDLADAYTVFDHWFSSVLGPTLPNRYYLHSGTADGHKSNLESIFSERGLTWKTLYHQLDEAGITWKYYFTDLPLVILFSGLHDRWNENIFPIDAYFTDAAAGRLPPVAIVDPGFTLNDDHPPHHPRLGQIFLSEVYDALATSPQWNECLFLLTYDEHGGFFDHVAPPQMDDDHGDEGFNQLGFRVPAIAAGPYVRRHAVVSEIFEHSAVSKWLAWRYGLEPLTTRARATGDLNLALDLERMNKRQPAAAVRFAPVKPPNDFGPHCKTGNDDLLIEQVAAKHRRRTPHHHDLELIFDSGRVTLPAHLDLRKRVPEFERMLAVRAYKRQF